MKTFVWRLLVLGCLLLSEWGVSQNAVSTDADITTFILVRHAEKAENSPDTDLSVAGKMRAKALDRLLSKLTVDAIYTTPLQRTQQTAAVVAQRHNLTIQTYDFDSKFPTLTDELATKHAGKTILLVGHSNTLPINIARLTNNSSRIEIPESEFDNVYFIQLAKDKTPIKFFHLKYGEE